MEESITEEPAGGLSSHSSEAEGQSDQSVFIKEEEGQGDQEEEVEGQGDQEEEVEGQGDQEEEVEGQGDQEEEVEWQGDQEEEVEGQGDQEEEEEGQGNQEEEVEWQGNQEEEGEGQGNQEEEVEGQGNQEEEVEGQGDQEEEVEGQGNQEEEVEGQGDQEEEVEWQGNQEEEGESVVSISSGEEETEANVVYVTDTTAEESVLEPDSAEPSLSGSPSVGQELSPGGAAASEQREEEEEEETDSVRPKTPEFKLGSQYRTLYRQLQQTEVHVYAITKLTFESCAHTAPPSLSISVSLCPPVQTLLHTMAERLPDGGQRLRVQRQEILDKISHIKKSPPPDLTSSASTASAGSKVSVYCTHVNTCTYFCSYYTQSVYIVMLIHTHNAAHTTYMYIHFTAIPEGHQPTDEDADNRSCGAASQVRSRLGNVISICTPLLSLSLPLSPALSLSPSLSHSLSLSLPPSLSLTLSPSLSLPLSPSLH